MKKFLGGLFATVAFLGCVATAVATIMFIIRFFIVGTVGDTYQLTRVQQLDGDVFFIAECARWYHPGMTGGKYFFVNSLQTEETARVKASQYLEQLKANQCVSRTTTITK